MNGQHFRIALLVFIFISCNDREVNDGKPITCDCPLEPIYDTIIISNEAFTFKAQKNKISSKVDPSLRIFKTNVAASFNFIKVGESKDSNKATKYTVITNKLGNDFSTQYGKINKLFCDRYRILCHSGQLKDSLNKLHQEFLSGFIQIIQKELPRKTNSSGLKKSHPSSISKPVDSFITIKILGNPSLLDGATIQFTDHSPLFKISSDHSIKLSSAQIKQLYNEYDQNLPVKLILKNNSIEIQDYLRMAQKFPHLPTTIEIQ